MKPQAFYHIAILTATGWQASRLFEKLAAARKWARWCSERWDSKIYRGGLGAKLVATYPRRAA